MQRRWMVKAFKIALLVTIVIAGFGHAVLQLWNHLMPDIFGLPMISFWQAVGLLGLSWILFGGLPGFHGSMRPRGRWRQDHMTPEQRDIFRKGVQGERSKCGTPAQQI